MTTTSNATPPPDLIRSCPCGWAGEAWARRGRGTTVFPSTDGGKPRAKPFLILYCRACETRLALVKLTDAHRAWIEHLAEQAGL